MLGTSKKGIKKHLYGVGMLLLGSVFYGVGYCLFIAPCRLVLGGATGAATLLQVLFSLPVPYGILLVNIPLLALHTLRNGTKELPAALLGILGSSLAIKAFSGIHPLSVPRLTGATLGGALTAVGIALLLHYGFTTGGSELAAALIRQFTARFSIGRLVLFIDTGIVLLSAFLMGESASLFYSVLLNLSFAITLDAVMGLLEHFPSLTSA